MKMTSYNHNLAAIFTAVIVFNFSSCKYEDGPKISLRTKKARLVGEWKVTKSPEEFMEEDAEFFMEFEKDGDFELSIVYTYEYYGHSYSYTHSYEGEWEWENNKNEIEISFYRQKMEFEIFRLTNKELWMEDDYFKDDWELEKI